MPQFQFSKACYATSQSGQVLKENMCADGFSCSLSSYTFNVEGEGNIQVKTNFCQKDEVDKGEMPILKALGAQVKRGAGHDPSNGPPPGVVQMIQKIKVFSWPISFVMLQTCCSNASIIQANCSWMKGMNTVFI